MRYPFTSRQQGFDRRVSRVRNSEDEGTGITIKVGVNPLRVYSVCRGFDRSPTSLRATLHEFRRGSRISRIWAEEWSGNWLGEPVVSYCPHQA